MLWHAMPPELNTARLMAGAGPAPMLHAASGWEALSVALEAQADQLSTILASLGAAWTGASGERAIAATTPMVAWLRTVAMQAQKRGLQASAQAAAYTTAMATTPSLPEIAANHMTRAVLLATNFLGINAVPIGLKETDYFVRLWNQAAAAMDVYQAETATNTLFEPLPPMKPIVLPDASAAAEAGTAGSIAEMAAKAADPSAFASVASDIGTAVSVEELPSGEQLMSFITQLSTQLGQFSGPIQQLTQLLQQTSTTGGLGDDTRGDHEDRDAPQLGLLDAPPLSTHPLAGGSGPSAGTGLLRAESMPGAGGSSPRTPVLSQLLDKPLPSVAPAAAGATAAGAGSSAIGGGGAPIGPMGGQGGHVGATRLAMAAPAMLAQDPDQSDQVDLDNEDDW